MSFANVAQYIQPSVFKGSAVTIPPSPGGTGVIIPAGQLASLATINLPANLRNALKYEISVSGALEDIDADGPGIVNLYYTGNADGSGVDGTETYISWETASVGIVAPFNRLYFQQSLYMEGPSETQYARTNQTVFEYAPQTPTTTSLYFIAQNTSATRTQVRIVPQTPTIGLTLRVTAYF